MVQSQANMFEKLNETVAELKRTMETTSANNVVKQELLETKQEMSLLREEVSSYQNKNQWRPSSGAWSRHNQSVHGEALLGETEIAKNNKTDHSLYAFVQQRLIRPEASVTKKSSPEIMEPRPLKMLKPPPKPAMTFRSYVADDYKAVYVEITPGRLSQIRSDLHAAGIDTKKVINISFINGRTAEFVIQKSYENVFKQMIGKELFIHENFDPSRPMDPAAPVSVIQAFRRSFAQRIQNIISNSRMVVVREFYEKMGNEKGISAFLPSAMEGTSKVGNVPESNEETFVNPLGQNGNPGSDNGHVGPVINSPDETQIQRSANKYVIDTQLTNSQDDGSHDDTISFTSEELRIIESQLAREIAETEDFPKIDLHLQQPKRRSNKGKEPSTTDEEYQVRWIKTKRFDEESFEDAHAFMDEDVEISRPADQPCSSRTKRRVFQKVDYTSSPETQDYENMDFSQ
jgi:hypothetical protein